LTPDNVFWTPQADTQVSISWSQGANKDKSSSTVDTDSFNGSLTIAGKSKLLGFEGKGGFEYNTSKATTTLNQKLSTYSESAGVVLRRGIGGGPTTDANYRYQAQAFIFGQKSPLGTIQTDIPQNTDIKAQGFLSVGYVANPLSKVPIQSGNFWKLA